MEYIIGAVIGILVGGGTGLFFEKLRLGAAYKSRDEILENISKEAENKKRELELADREEQFKRREKLEQELNQEREKLRTVERGLDERELQLKERDSNQKKQEQMLETTQSKLTTRSKAVEAKDVQLTRLLKDEQEQLYKISSLSAEEAKGMLLDRLDRELKTETGSLVLKHRNELKDACDKEAQEVIAMAVQRYASAHTSESTVSTVDIPSDEMKGRIIGREGRNIRAFEKATGVDVIVDDTPGVVIVSAFDNVRRQIAKLALEKLIQDGRIHPSRIEELVEETKQEMEENIRRIGQEACQEAGMLDMHPKLTELMGRLSFRTSYSQNVLRHSIEVSALAGLMAEQLGLDGVLARRCGFFHDIGKAADHEMEGGHPAVGAQLLKRYNEGEVVVHAALGHHDDIRVEYIYTVLVAAADAVSAARPGARRETLEKYVRRLEELEAVACGFPGVEQAFAVQAGREIRVIVDAKQVDDRESAKMCRDMATAIEETLTYPGEIKVTILRETRITEYAK